LRHLKKERFLAETANQGGPVGDAKSYILSARGLLEFASSWMETVAIDSQSGEDFGRSFRKP